MKALVLIFILLLAGCSDEVVTPPPAEPKLQDCGPTLTIRTIDDGGWFGSPTKEVLFDNGAGVVVPGNIEDDGAINAGGDSYYLSVIEK